MQGVAAGGIFSADQGAHFAALDVEYRQLHLVHPAGHRRELPGVEREHGGDAAALASGSLGVLGTDLGDEELRVAFAAVLERVGAAETVGSIQETVLTERKPSFFDALILICSPVAGLRPRRAGRFFTWKMPRPVMRTLWPFFRFFTVRSTKALRNSVEAFLVISCFSASSAASFDSAIVCTLSSAMLFSFSGLAGASVISPFDS